MNKPIVFILFMILMGFSFDALSKNSSCIEVDSIQLCATDTVTIITTDSTQLITCDTIKTRADQNKKRFVSALFAFPFPFGFMGAHRVMLGTKPWIPVVYVATFGGCFGLLPLIDFCVITFSKNLEQYENNPRLFMWIKSSE